MIRRRRSADRAHEVETHSSTLTDCAAPGHTAWLGSTVDDDVAVTCNANDRRELLADVAAGW